MQLPRRWPVRDDLCEIDAWVDRETPSEARRHQVQDFLFTLMVNPLNFPLATHNQAMEDERQGTVPGTDVVVSFLIMREEHEVHLTGVNTRA